MYKTQILEKYIDFVDVFPDIQEYIRNENPKQRFDFGLIDVVEFLKNDTDNWEVEKQDAVNIDDAIYRIVTNFSKTKKGKELNIDKAISEVENNMQNTNKKELPSKKEKTVAPKKENGDKEIIEAFKAKIKAAERSLKFTSGEKKENTLKKIRGYKRFLKMKNQ